MTDALSAFERFRLWGAELERFRSGFAAVIDSTDLARTPELKSFVLEYDEVPGIYFWTAVEDAAEFKIYAGKTKSLGYRVTNYTAPFQPHSPNDYKLLVFAAFLEELSPGAALRLYFKQAGVPELLEQENRVISSYRPLLNIPRSPSPEAKNQLKAAFAAYYRSSFEGVLNDRSRG